MAVSKNAKKQNIPNQNGTVKRIKIFIGILIKFIFRFFMIGF